ncbi:MAG: hypothetical protein LBK92_03830 [Endomicrobium sp.]|jgi:hypothetical protein|nr:hypothetical protein [Endomicrobium sp.]
MLAVKHYPSCLLVSKYGQEYIIQHDGLYGEFTKEEWRQEEPLSLFNKEEQAEILQALDNSCNINFFREV